MKNSKLILGLVALLILLAVPLVSFAATVYIQTVTINYSVDSLKTTTSDAVKYEYDNVSYLSTWSKSVTDMTSGYYTQFTLQKKSGLIYKNIDTLTVNNPVVGASVRRNINGVGSGNCRFKIYNYSVNTTGKLTVSISNQQYT